VGIEKSLFLGCFFRFIPLILELLGEGAFIDLPFSVLIFSSPNFAEADLLINVFHAMAYRLGKFVDSNGFDHCPDTASFAMM